MGRQVNFYILQADREELQTMLQKRGNVAFLPWISTTATIRPVPTLADANWISRNIDIASVVLKYVQSQSHWLVDEARSPVIKFSPGGLSGSEIIRGRFHFELGFYDADGYWVTKSPEFVQWADRILRWVCRHYVKESHGLAYIGPYADKGVKDGVYRLRII
ncbi:MAG: hypothetical protein HZB53_00525 [Chloroflexi bacterium]|nr:hypothetical protein [Chloroflexota bacterium]